MAETESIIRKLLPLLLLLITTIVSVALVASRTRRNIGAFNSFVKNNRDTSALVIQILSSILGSCQVYAICSTLNFSTRLYFHQNSIPLPTLSFWSAFVTPRLEFSLSKWHLVTLAIWYIMSKIPGALWAGALTPLFVPVFQKAGTISIPTYPLHARRYWDSEFVRYSNGQTDRLMRCTKTTDTPYQNWTGPFVSSCPDIDFMSALTDLVGSASPTSDSSPWVHSNLFQPDWSFIGRSYGVGSSPALINPAQTAPIAFSAYNYTEIGYFTNVTCIQNVSASYEVLYLKQYGTQAIEVGLWAANGTLPNSVPGSFELYPLITRSKHQKFVLAWSSVVNNGQNLIAVAAPGGTWYHPWNKMQCSVEFYPSLFAVAVNLTSKTITVTQSLEHQSQNITDIEQTGNLTANVMLALDRLSRMSSNLDVSVLGNSLIWNMVNIQRSSPNITQAEAHIRGLEDSFTAVLDDLLVAYGAMELVLAHASKESLFSGFYSALKVGSDRYIFAILGVNLALLIVLAMETRRTRFWKGLTSFNYTDVKHVVVATSAGEKSRARTYPVPSLDNSSSRTRSESGYELEDDMAPILLKLVEHNTRVVFTTGNDDTTIELLK
ncbi:hypothetical protein BP5796_12241 [Coleophoma crateriformis]|uniref:Uncharacterized protein n=1 Tax=Coleophoma crateriformis TaxID=565419 RepID=A0A3D8Q922_9HELO|nr:hypothetical protein BP5796_12241 [Coleophoma crateriformis]